MASITDTSLSRETNYGTRSYTGTVSMQNIDKKCDGTLILQYDNGVLQGKYLSLGVQNVLTLSTSTPDTEPITADNGSYEIKFYEGRSLSYTIAATEYTCGCCYSNCAGENCSYSVLINADDTNISTILEEDNLKLIPSDPLELIRLAKNNISKHKTGYVDSFIDFTEIDSCDYQVCIV